MKSTYGTDQPHLQNHELTRARQFSERIYRTRLRQAIYGTIIFLSSCTAVSLFLKGSLLPSYWDTLGKYFLLLTMGLLTPFVICVGRAFNAWLFVREMKKLDS